MNYSYTKFHNQSCTLKNMPCYQGTSLQKDSYSVLVLQSQPDTNTKSSMSHKCSHYSWQTTMHYKNKSNATYFKDFFFF